MHLLEAEWRKMVVAELKKIMVSLPGEFLEEIDCFAKEMGITRSRLLRDATADYMRKQSLSKISQQLKKGYEQMSEINLSLAEGSLQSDNEALLVFEEKLSESE